MIYVFASFILFAIWYSARAKQAEKKKREIYDAYWEREYKSNFIRKKPIDDLAYVDIPFDVIAESLLADRGDVAECLSTLHQLSQDKIVNFTGKSNTDLKMEYGTANLTLLSRYDENYTIYARTIHKLAMIYVEAGYPSNACILLERLVDTGVDIAHVYEMLLSLYETRPNQAELVATLREKAEQVPSINKEKIVRLCDGSNIPSGNTPHI